MSVPGFIIAKIDLNQTHACFDKATCQKERPTEGVATVPFQRFFICSGHIEQLTHFSVRQHRKGSLLETIKAVDFRKFFKINLLLLDLFKKFASIRKMILRDRFRELQAWELEAKRVRILLASLVMESVFWPSSISGRIKSATLKEVGISLRPHGPCELPRDHPPRPMDQFFWKDNGGGKIVLGRGHITRNRRDRGMVRGLRRLWVESRRHLGSSRENGHMALRMLIVRVGQTSDDRPAITSLSQLGKVLTNAITRRPRCDRAKLTTYIRGGQRFGIETLVLCQSP